MFRRAPSWAWLPSPRRLLAYYSRGAIVLFFLFVTIARFTREQRNSFIQAHMTLSHACREYNDYVMKYKNDTGWLQTKLKRINFTERAPALDTIHYDPICPDFPPSLVGTTNVSLVPQSWNYLNNLAKKLSIEEGGSWGPKHCRARYRVAIIIPYRDRDAHLRVLMRYLHSHLQRQLLEYRVFVSEQDHLSTFNRGMIKNLGVYHALELFQPDCVIMHDVDLVPENDHNRYYCSDMPTHLSVAIDIRNYEPPYPWHFGGVVTMKSSQFVRLNGYSNVYFGWGSEDDDLSKRIRRLGMTVIQQDQNIGRYRMLGHKPDAPNENRWNIVRWAHCRYDIDGIKSMKYKLLGIEKHKLFTLIRSSIDEKTVMDSVPLPPAKMPKLTTWQKFKSFFFNMTHPTSS